MTAGRRWLNRKRIVLLSAGVGCLVVLLILLVAKVLLTGDSGHRQQRLQVVTLLPPPPKLEEKPLEPEKPEEKIEEPRPEEPKSEPEAADEPPAERLGLDADAGLGGDAFGLEARKGGQGLIGGRDGGMGNWYTTLLSSHLQKRVNEIVQQRGGLPAGDWRTVVRLELDPRGRIRRYEVIGSSGNSTMDEAVVEALARSGEIGETPPPEMPRVMRLSFAVQG